MLLQSLHLHLTSRNFHRNIPLYNLKQTMKNKGNLVKILWLSE